VNKRIRQLFEKHTIPNFGPFDGRPHKNMSGEYFNPVIEDHWQTFQEAAELIVRECANICDSDDDTTRILDAFGVEQ
jgi:hypothetical protein